MSLKQFADGLKSVDSCFRKCFKTTPNIVTYLHNATKLKSIFMKYCFKITTKDVSRFI